MRKYSEKIIENAKKMLDFLISEDLDGTFSTSVQHIKNHTKLEADEQATARDVLEDLKLIKVDRYDCKFYFKVINTNFNELG